MAQDYFDADLAKAVNDIRILDGQCIIVLTNNASAAGVNATINSAAVKFFYSDGTDYTDGPRNVNLPVGANTSFHSNDPDKCVKQFYAVAVASAPGYNPGTFDWRDAAGDGECLISDGIELGPKGSIAESEINEITLGTYLKLKRRN